MGKNIDWIIFKDAFNKFIAVWIIFGILLVGGAITLTVGILEEEVLIFIGAGILAFSVVPLATGIWTQHIAFTQPHNLEAADWWVQFVGGALGAFSFSVPSIFILPILLLTGQEDMAWLGALFTGLGSILTIVFIFWMRHMYKSRPDWIQSSNHHN